jgi:hypothetical protein
VARTSRNDLPSIGAGLGEINRKLREAMLGRLNVAGEVTIATGTTTTLIEDQNFTFTTEITLTPRNSTGAALAWWLAARNKGSITLGHAAPGSDLTFGYIAAG